MIFGRAFLWSLSFRGVVLEFFPLAAEVTGFSGFPVSWFFYEDFRVRRSLRTIPPRCDSIKCLDGAGVPAQTPEFTPHEPPR